MLVSEQVGAMETVSLSHPITMHNTNVCVRLSAASHLLKQTSVKSAANCLCQHNTHTHTHGLRAYLLDCSIFVVLILLKLPLCIYMTLLMYLKKKAESVKLVLLSFLQKMWPTSFTT